MLPVINHLPLRTARRRVRLADRLFTACCYAACFVALIAGTLSLYCIAWAAVEVWRALA